MTATLIYSEDETLPSLQSVNISTFDDNILEGDHAFTVIITETSADPMEIVTISTQSSQTVVINDDESKSNLISL